MFFVVSSSAATANSPPVVSNINVSQRTDGSKLVDIYYDLGDADGDACLVTVQASSDGGSTWAVPITALTGDVGPSVAPSVGKHIVWDSWTDLPGAVGNQFRVRVCADDGYLPTPEGVVLIPAGWFRMGDTFGDGYSDETPVHDVYIDAFLIDRYEVTNAQYVAGLNWAQAQGGLIEVSSGVVYKAGNETSYPYCTTTSAPPDYPDYGYFSGITWNGSTFGVVSGKEDYPMVQVSWYGSVAYANWRSAIEGKPLCYDLSTWTCNFGVAGYRLPTEAEWEKAARGGAPGHRFPWSDSDMIQLSRANYRLELSNSHTYYPYDTISTPAGFPNTSPVGYFAPNGYGLYDMAGNVREWCNDWWSGSYYSSPPHGMNSDNPYGPATGTNRVLRGGSWYDDAFWQRCAVRLYGRTPDTRDYAFGFRLALDSE